MIEKYTRDDIANYVHRFLVENDLTYRELASAFEEFYPGGVSHSVIGRWVKHPDELPSERILNVIYQYAPTKHSLFRFADDLLTMIASIVWQERQEKVEQSREKIELL